MTDDTTVELERPADEEPAQSESSPPPNNNSVARSWHYRLLWIIVIVSLGLNATLLIGLISFRAEARRQVEDASALLDTVEIGDFDLPVTVDEQLAVSMTVPFSDTFLVPISATVPVSTSILFTDTIPVPINTNIPINTNVNVPVQIAGSTVNIPIPISTDIPVNLDVEVPISTSVPVNIDIPVDLMVDVPIQSDIPISTTIPVQLDFPVTIPMDQMGFQQLVQEVQDALELLAQLLGA